MSDNQKKYLYRWWIFTKERFDPLSHTLMITLFFAGHYLIAKASATVTLSNLHLIMLFTGTVLFFYKLRLYDEIKDYDTDLIFNPTRPLPRGLLSPLDMKKGAVLCVVIELFLFSSAGKPGLLAMLIAIIYSFFMYKEFFIGDLIRPHLTTYASSHTVVTIFLSLSIFSALLNQNIFTHTNDIYYFSILSWLLFNIFELGRKIYQPCEEREGIATYSNIWGKYGAVLLVLTHVLMAAMLTLSITTMSPLFMKSFQGFCVLSFIAVSLIYLSGKTSKTGKLFRKFSEAYIVLIYLGIITNYII